MSTIAAFQPLTSSAVKSSLSTKAFGRVLHLFDEVPSTNTVAADLAQNGAPHGTLVVSEAQSAGRGRMGRLWHSPHGKNLYCSLILRTWPPSDTWPMWLSWIPLISAVATARTVQVTAGLRPFVKWPNDIVIGSRKVGGILCESTGGAGASPGVIIIGIGLNVNVRLDSLPKDILDLGTSMAIEAGRPFDRAVVLSTLLSELEIRYEAMVSGGLDDVADEYRMRCSTIGKRIRVTLAGEAPIEGIAESIAANGALRVLPDGSPVGFPIEVQAGDVVHVR
ncbi:MAG: biotin--[acetyl-CoA-carboxylase] ligase [Nitrospiraceae bacterium]|nr:biotin--[acetyl-CoA-carboxylase] ligase [Nitrospiraceae bacterium]